MCHLADGRQRAEWARAASLAASVHRSMTGETIDPADLVPERFRESARAPTRPLTPAEVERQNRGAWALLDMAFGRRG